MRHKDDMAAILGVAQVPMRTRIPEMTYPDLLATVAARAVEDAGLARDEIDGLILAQAPTATLGVDEPQYWGIAGLPGAHAFLGRVHVAAASGLSAVRLAASYVASGRAKHVLVVAADLADEGDSLRGALAQMHDPFTSGQAPINAITAAALQSTHYMATHGLSERIFAAPIVKNRLNGVGNPYAQLRKPVTAEEVLDSPVLSWPIKRLESSPRTSGAAAVVIGKANSKRSVRIEGFGNFAGAKSIGAQMVPGWTSYLDGSDVTQAAQRAYSAAGISNPQQELDFAEVYTSFSIFELLSIEGLGLCAKGEAARRIDAGEFHRGSRLPVNATGGATCGNPISAGALVRIADATAQLRGEAGDCQVEIRHGRAVVTAIGGLFQTHEVGVLAI